MKEHIAHTGAWGLALIVIVLVSWFFYRYFAPKSWREWAGAGLVQAFIIALYAEMYGFPITIYFLVRFFGLDRVDLNANLWSTLVGLGETGMMISMIAGYFILFTGIGIIGEGWRELYRARQENRLVTDRLYGLARHPQYTGLFIALFGEGIVHWPTIFSVSLFPVIGTGLCPAGAIRGVKNGEAVRGGVSSLPEAGADVYSSLGSMAKHGQDTKRRRNPVNRCDPMLR